MPSTTEAGWRRRLRAKAETGDGREGGGEDRGGGGGPRAVTVAGQTASRTSPGWSRPPPWLAPAAPPGGGGVPGGDARERDAAGRRGGGDLQGGELEEPVQGSLRDVDLLDAEVGDRLVTVDQHPVAELERERGEPPPPPAVAGPRVPGGVDGHEQEVDDGISPPSHPPTRIIPTMLAGSSGTSSPREPNTRHTWTMRGSSCRSRSSIVDAGGTGAGGGTGPGAPRRGSSGWLDGPGAPGGGTGGGGVEDAGGGPSEDVQTCGDTGAAGRSGAGGWSVT
jgi:hypothetical protein